MSHDPEAAEAMARVLHEVACPCGGWPCCWEHDPDDPTDEPAEVSMARYQRDAPRLLRYLAAAGYTVTKSDAVAAEREACAGAVDEMCDDVDDPFMYGTLRAVAAAIRNRGEAT